MFRCETIRNMKTIFPTIKPSLTKTHMGIPTDAINGYEAGLTSKEWLYLLYSNLFSDGISIEELEKEKKLKIKSLGSRTTIWRIKNSLKRKGY